MIRHIVRLKCDDGIRSYDFLSSIKADMKRHSLFADSTCLFGGSFDPVHLGHGEMAAQVIEQLGVKKLVLVPCRISPFKQKSPPAPAEDRLEMLRRAAATLERTEVCSWELEQPGPSFSWQTVEYFLKKEGGPLSWLMGADQWHQLTQWSRADYLAEQLTFIVFPRGNQPAEPRQGYRMKKIDFFSPVSSTEVRSQISAQKDGWESLVLPTVAQWIKERGLYRSAAG